LPSRQAASRPLRDEAARDETLQVVKAQGADHVINCKAETGIRSFKDEVKALTGGEGVDVVYDGVGGDISTESLRAVRLTQQGPAGRAQRQPAADQPDPDEGP